MPDKSKPDQTDLSAHPGADEIQKFPPLSRQQRHRSAAVRKFRNGFVRCHFSVRLLLPYIGFIPPNRKGFG